MGEEKNFVDINIPTAEIPSDVGSTYETLNSDTITGLLEKANVGQLAESMQIKKDSDVLYVKVLWKDATTAVKYNKQNDQEEKNFVDINIPTSEIPSDVGSTYETLNSDTITGLLE